jgi:hypothetical protein
MTNKTKKILISVGSIILVSYLSIFIYQRIQRAKADASVVSEDEALDILDEKESTTIPDFDEEDLIPVLPNDEIVENEIDSLKQFEIETGYGDY